MAKPIQKPNIFFRNIFHIETILELSKCHNMFEMVRIMYEINIYYYIINVQFLPIILEWNNYLSSTVTDCFHQYDGFIYRREKKISLTTWLKEKIGISSQNITELLRRDGEYALKQHLPLISDVMNKQDLEPMTIINMFQEYSQVLRGGVKDHFLSSQTQYEASYWQTVYLLYFSAHVSSMLNFKAFLIACCPLF